MIDAAKEASRQARILAEILRTRMSESPGLTLLVAGSVGLLLGLRMPSRVGQKLLTLAGSFALSQLQIYLEQHREVH